MPVFQKNNSGQKHALFFESLATQHAVRPVADERSKWPNGANFIRFLAEAIFGKHLPNWLVTPHPMF